MMDKRNWRRIFLLRRNFSPLKIRMSYYHVDRRACNSADTHIFGIVRFRANIRRKRVPLPHFVAAAIDPGVAV